MNKKKTDKRGLLIGFLGLVLVLIVSYVVITSNQTKVAWVPAVDMKAGHTIQEEDLMALDVPAKTPSDFLTSKSQIVGFKLRNGVEKGEFLYPSDFLASWESYNEDEEIHEDYVVVSLTVPDKQAVAGLITAGDYIDIMGVSTSGPRAGFDQRLEGINGRDNIETSVYYILANVKVLNTNSSLSTAQDGDMAELASSDSSGSSSYILALSYDDAKKLRQAEGMFDLWLNIAPRQNRTNPPLLKQMVGQSFSGLHDARFPVQDKEGNPLTNDELQAMWDEMMKEEQKEPSQEQEEGNIDKENQEEEGNTDKENEKEEENIDKENDEEKGNIDKENEKEDE